MNCKSQNNVIHCPINIQKVQINLAVTDAQKQPVEEYFHFLSIHNR